MKIKYDTTADAIYFTLRDGIVDKTISVSDLVHIDVDKNGETLGIELLEASTQQGIDLQNNLQQGIPVEILSPSSVTL